MDSEAVISGRTEELILSWAGADNDTDRTASVRSCSFDNLFLSFF